MHARRTAGSLWAGVALTIVTPLAARADAPPSPWSFRDVGVLPKAGSTDVDAAGVWTLKSTSGDLWQDNDQYHLATMPVSGDAAIQARFLTVSGGDNQWGQVGITIRANDTPGSPRTDLVMTHGEGLCDQTRFQQDRPASPFLQVGARTAVEPNLYLRLQRTGNDLSGFYSHDGQLWVQATPVQSLPALASQALFGLKVASLGAGITTGKMDGVSVLPGAALPYGLQTCGADHAVQIQWRRVPGAVGYMVYRGAKDATGAQLTQRIAQPINATTFTDTASDLVNGTAVLYAVSAIFQAADGSQSEGPRVATLGMPVAAPAGLLGCSLNEGPVHGSVAVEASTGVLTLRGGGSWFNANGDQGYFLNRAVDGDGQITVRLLGKVTTGGPDRLAGVMIRESLDRDARHVTFGLYNTGANAVLERLWRDTTSGFNAGLLSHSGVTITGPVLLRLTRVGDSITPAYSLDEGKNWIIHRPVTFPAPLPQTLYYGLATTGGNIFGGSRNTLSTAQFSVPEIGKP
jgi:hypothetical protein